MASAALIFVIAWNGRRLSSIKVAGNEVSTDPPTPTASDVMAVKNDKATPEETKDATDDAPAAGKAVDGVTTFRAQDVPLDVLVDAAKGIRKQDPKSPLTLTAVEYVLRKPGKGQPWFVKLSTGSFWRVSYTGPRAEGEEGTAKVTRVAESA